MPATATSLDLQQAKDDLEADLRELLTFNLLKDLTPELEGWAQAIRAAVADGERAAAFGIDTRQRDRTFAVRRQLGDYARAARLVGALNPRANDEFRSLGQSLDEAASVLLVMMGESIANTGIAGGRYLMQVPFSELQTRREAVLNALRNLNGSSQYAYGPNDWPRGVDSYRQLFDVLDRQGQGELRSLLTENGISRVMDQLIDRAGQGVNGLRALGATVMLEVQQFNRLIAAIHWGIDDMDSPPLMALQEALQLFIDGFRPSGGIRLLGIARPQILSYGLYGNRALSAPEVRLESLLRLRGNLATNVDCYASCVCDGKTAASQILMDLALYDVDRAIDLYAIGTGSIEGEPEIRAASYGYLLDAISARAKLIGAGDFDEVTDLIDDPVGGSDALLVNPLLPKAKLDPARNLMLQELQIMRQQEGQLHDMAAQMGDGCGLLDDIYRDVASAGESVGDVPAVFAAARFAITGVNALIDPPDVSITLPSPIEISNDRQVNALLMKEIQALQAKIDEITATLRAQNEELDEAAMRAADAGVTADEARQRVNDLLAAGTPPTSNNKVNPDINAALTEWQKSLKAETKAQAEIQTRRARIAIDQQKLAAVQTGFVRVLDQRPMIRPITTLGTPARRSARGGRPRQASSFSLKTRAPKSTGART